MELYKIKTQFSAPIYEYIELGKMLLSYHYYCKLSMKHQFSLVTVIIDIAGNTNKMELDRMFLNGYNHSCHTLCYLYHHLSKYTDSTLVLIRIFKALQCYRDKKCIEFNYRDKTSVNYNQMLSRYAMQLKPYLCDYRDIIDSNSVYHLFEQQTKIDVEIKEFYPCKLCGEKSEKHFEIFYCTVCEYCG